MRIEDMIRKDDSNDTSTNSPDFFYWNVWGQPTDENLYFDIRVYKLILIFPRVYLSLLHDSRTGPRRTWKAIFVQGGLKSSRHEMRLCILQNKPYTWEKICHFLMHLRQGVSWGYVYIYIYIYLADFLKTNLTKLAVIWMKKGQTTLFLSPRSSKIIVTKQRERRKRKSEEKERRRRKKSKGCTLSFYK